MTLPRSIFLTFFTVRNQIKRIHILGFSINITSLFLRFVKGNRKMAKNKINLGNFMQYSFSRVNILKYIFFYNFHILLNSLLSCFHEYFDTSGHSHSYWLIIFCTTNRSRVLARERWQTFENSWKKTQHLMNNLFISW